MASKKTTKNKPAAKAKISAKKPAKKTAKPVKKVQKPAPKQVKKASAQPAKKAVKPAKKVTKPKPKAVVKKKAAPKVKPKVKAKPKAVVKKKPVVIKKKAAAKKVVSKKPIKKTVVKKTTKKVVKKSAPVAKKPVAVAKKQKPVSKVVKKTVAKKPVVKEQPKKALPKKEIKPVKAKEVVKPVKPAPVPVVKEKTPKKIAAEQQKVKEKTGRKKAKKIVGDDDEPKIDELDPIVEELMSSKKKSKLPKVPKIPSPIKLIPTVKIEAVEKEHVIPKNFRNGGKEKYEMEFFIKSSPRILYNFISSPSGLSEWFSDDVNIKNGIYTFLWEDSEETAKLLATREFEFMRFKWTNTDDDDTYFEMRIKIDELTGDVALIITDFAKKEELDEVQRLWDAQIHDLCKALGGS